MSVVSMPAARIAPESELEQIVQLAVTLSGRMARLHLDNIGAAIAEALGQIARATRVDGCQLLEFTESGSVARTHLAAGTTFAGFFEGAHLHPNAARITGVVCGVRVEAIEDPLMQRIRYLDKLVDELAKGRVRAFMSTDISEIQPSAVLLKSEGGVARSVPNDFVVACLGGELPTEFLKAVGVGIRRHQGDRAMANPALASRLDSTAA